MTQIAVLGCGPAGLLVAHAIELAGHSPVIISRRVQSPMAGAMYLHRSIPGLTESEPDGTLVIGKTGTAEGYATKVYGDPGHDVSFTKFEHGSVPMWSLTAAYAKLWERYEGVVMDHTITHDDVSVMVGNYDMIFSTIPKHLLCRHTNPEYATPAVTHAFSSQRIYLHRRPRQGPWMVDQMIYNGQERDDWYRYSAIGEHECWEYSSVGGFPEDFHPEKEDWFSGAKPIANDCDCWPTIHNVGRFGAWTKGQLTHHAFEQAVDLIGLRRSAGALH